MSWIIYFCFNAHVRPATALWYILSDLLERPGTVEWRHLLFLVIMIQWTEQTTASVVSLCETQCLSKNIFIEPIHAFIVKSFYFQSDPLYC